MERSTELLFEKRKVQELIQFKDDYDYEVERHKKEIEELKIHFNKETKVLREKV